MTREEAIRILDPATTGEALAEIEYYAGFSGATAKVQAVTDACEVAVSALRELEQHRWIPVTERLPKDDNERVLVFVESGAYNYPVGNHPIDTDRYWGKHGKWVRYGDKVTHWMPLPESPKEEPK